MENTYVCGKLIKQIHDELDKQANSVLSSQNLTLTQMHVLMELETAPEHQLSLKELEGLLHVAQSTTAGIVLRLEQKGYLKCYNDARDRRVKKVSITDTGLECCKNAQSHIKYMENHLLSALTESERTIFCSLLQKVCKGVYLWK